MEENTFLVIGGAVKNINVKFHIPKAAAILQRNNVFGDVCLQVDLEALEDLYIQELAAHAADDEKEIIVLPLSKYTPVDRSLNELKRVLESLREQRLAKLEESRRSAVEAFSKWTSFIVEDGIVKVQEFPDADLLPNEEKEKYEKRLLACREDALKNNVKSTRGLYEQWRKRPVHVPQFVLGRISAFLGEEKAGEIVGWMQQQEQYEIKRRYEDEAKVTREREEWVKNNGSYELRRMLEEGIDYRRSYENERMKKDLPGWVRLAVPSFECRNVMKEDFDLLDKARESIPSARLCCVDGEALQGVFPCGKFLGVDVVFPMKGEQLWSLSNNWKK